MVNDHALKILMTWEASSQYVDHVLSRSFAEHTLSPSEKAQLTDLVNGVVRWRKKIDWIIHHFLQTKDRKLPVKIRQVLRLAIYRILRQNSIAPQKVVNEAVDLARRHGHRGTANLTNAVLRNVLRNQDTLPFPDLEIAPVDHLAVCYSHPEWLIERWLKIMPVEEVIELAEANNRRPDLFIRVNRTRTTATELSAMLPRENFVVEPAPYFPANFLKVSGGENLFQSRAYVDGMFQPQDPGAGAVIHLADPQPGWTILDLCAAPGGKTTYLAEWTDQKSTILANDNKKDKLLTLAANCRRLGLANIAIVAEDGRHFTDRDKFDLVLVDAPCSGTGVLSRRSDARWQRQPGDLAKLNRLQIELLRSAANRVKPGGVLIYSTCSIDPSENEELVRTFLQESPNFEMENASGYLPESLINNGFLQTFPHRHGIDGSFGARLKLKDNNQ